MSTDPSDTVPGSRTAIARRDGRSATQHGTVSSDGHVPDAAAEPAPHEHLPPRSDDN